jgi:FMN reductase
MPTVCDPSPCLRRSGARRLGKRPASTRLSSRWRENGVDCTERKADGCVNLTILVGNPKPKSRTLGVAATVADALTPTGSRGTATSIDLADVAMELFDHESAIVPALLEQVASSDVVIVASPTYKATYTGLLKSFLDRYGNNSLASIVAVPVMTGAAPIHALAPEVSLRPLLVELGASVPCRGLFVTEGDLENLDATVAKWASSAVPLIDRALGRSTGDLA